MSYVKNFRFFCVWFFVCFSFPLIANEYSNFVEDSYKEAVLKEIPSNISEVDEVYEKTKEKLDQFLQKIALIPHSRLTFENTLYAYDQMAKKYFSNVGILATMDLLYKDQQFAEYAMYRCLELWDHFFASIHNECFITILLDYIEQALKSSQSSHEMHYIKNFLNFQNDSLSNKILKRINALKEKANAKEDSAFTFLKGAAGIQSNSQEFSLMTWNVCGLPGNTSLPFGGILPWKKRLSSIIHVIREANAEVVCLQEVFDERLSKHLYEALKDKYAYFYINIGPKNMGLDDGSVGIGSGLFIASQYPINNPHWHGFQSIYLQGANRGCFSFSIQNKNQQAHVFTTHLESSITFKLEDDYRVLQLKEICELCSNIPTNGPWVLCGDMNVYLGSNEPAEKLINELFVDTYSQNIARVTDRNCTYCDLTGYFWPEYVLNFERKHFNAKQDILDYVLIFKKLPSGKTFKNYSARTYKLKVNDRAFPVNAVSDHHPLISYISWNSQ